MGFASSGTEFFKNRPLQPTMYRAGVVKSVMKEIAYGAWS
jgi:hypothetical protein